MAGQQEYDEFESNVVQRLMDYEDGTMEDEDEILDLFQDLVDTGLAWGLQGSYGRTANALIDAGKIRRQGW